MFLMKDMYGVRLNFIVFYWIFINICRGRFRDIIFDWEDLLFERDLELVDKYVKYWIVFIVFYLWINFYKF